MTSNYLTMRIQRIYICLTVFLLSISIVPVSYGQDDKNSVLWEITGNGLSQPSYIFGIINFLPKNEFTVSSVVNKAMDDCKVFVTKSPTNNASRKKFYRATRIPNEGWINDYLTDDELNELRLLMLLELEVSEHDYHYNYSRLQPVILVTATTLLYLSGDVVFVEQQLIEAAKKNRLKSKSLGTIEEEIAAFDKFPIPDQVEALKYTVKNFDEHIDNYKKLVKYYKEEQDLDKIQEEILKATNRSQLFQEAYYDNRNKVWSGKIGEIIGKDPAFIAIGATHLAGQYGLIQLLREKGYTMSPVNAFE